MNSSFRIFMVYAKHLFVGELRATIAYNDQLEQLGALYSSGVVLLRVLARWPLENSHDRAGASLFFKGMVA